MSSLLTYQSYFDHLLIQDGDSGLSEFGEKLRTYSLNSLKDQAVGLHFDEWNEVAENTFMKMLNSTFRATSNAEPAASEKFPVLIYHPGLGGNIIENIILFEFLASQGFIVISSSFHYQSDWSTSFYCGETKNSLEDIDFIIQNIAEKIPHADMEKIGLLGHSFGAQAGYAYITRPNNTIRAFVSLDNTFDYRPIATIESPPYANTSWGIVLKSLTDDYINCKAPILNISGSMDDGSVPDYDLVRRLFKSDIYFGSYSYPMLHASFLSEAILTYPLVEEMYSEEEVALLKTNTRSYYSLVPVIAEFFNQTLKQASPEVRLRNKEIQFIRQAPAVFPTKQNLLETWQNHGIDSIKTLYEKYQKISPKARINCTAILDQMTTDGNSDDQIAFLEFLIAFNPKDWKLLNRLGDCYLQQENNSSACQYFQSAEEFCDDILALSEIREKLTRIKK